MSPRLPRFGAVLAASVLLSACAAPLHHRPGTRWAYPDTPTVAQFDDYHGVVVADPWRWLEDLDSPQTHAWVNAENRLTFSFLNTIPERKAIAERLARLWNYERVQTPVKRGGRLFFRRNNGLQNQAVLFVQDAPGAEPRVLLDPNKLSEDGTVALAGTSFSEDGHWMAYSLAAAGSDWSDWFVRNVDTGKDTGDHLQWTKFTGASWTRDGKGFFYSRYPEPPEDQSRKAANKNNKLFFHKLGEDQARDELIYERPDHPDWGFNARVTEDGRWLLIAGWQGTDPRARIWYRDLQEGGSIQPLLTAFDAAYDFIGNEGTTWFFRTDKDAPRGRVIAFDVEHPEPAGWREILPEREDALQSVSFLDHSLVARYLHDATSSVEVFDPQGKRRFPVDLPALGTAGAFSGRPDEPVAYYSFTSFTYPTTIYSIDLESGKSTVFRRPKVDFRPGDYEVEQVWYPSKDGTQVPMFLVHRRGLVRDGNNPVYLYGYGGFNISLTPSFRASNLVWLEMGGIYAMPNLRGGGEFGEAWHKAGSVLHKQNVFDDFIAAAEWLIANKYTRREKLAIGGGSNGGLLVGACLTQRPDLYGAALPAVGVLDMLRFHKFTIGWAWASDYGTSDDPEQFKVLRSYSPYHNIHPGVHYPPTLITTADHDDRVVPAHSFKFAAALQKAQGGPDPVLIRIETRAGHGAGKPVGKIIAEAADRWAFLVRELGLKPASF